MKISKLVTFTIAFVILVACSRRDPPEPAAHGKEAPTQTPIEAPSAQTLAPSKRPAPVREGGSIVRAANEEALYIAHEDLGEIRRVPLPVDIANPTLAIKMPGPPAAVLALHNRVLVTIRAAFSSTPGAPPEGPGFLLIMKPDLEKGLVEEARVELPPDAWGLAVTPDESTALVTSAWSHNVSAVDLTQAKKRWSINVSREPRGVVILPDGKTAYITHLVRSALTRIDGINAEPSARDVSFPAAPLRTIKARSDAATLGYAAALSPDGSRLFVPRHALGAFGSEAWNGQATVDILTIADELPLAQDRRRWFIMLAGQFMKDFTDTSISTKDPHLSGPGPIQKTPPFIQPRAVVYRKKTRTLLVASEGTDALAELDALSIDPSTHALRVYKAGAPRDFNKLGETHCGAPSGIALSADEGTAFVFCRSSHDLSIIQLDAYDAKEPFLEAPIPSIPLGKDPLPSKAAIGRRLFHNASDGQMSGGYACAGCHPEGRDDGHVWHEDIEESREKPGEASAFRMHAFETQFGLGEGFAKGVPRQTPMLAGRVSAFGPYGWKNESPTLRHRVMVGFGIHNWWGRSMGSPETIERAESIVAFLREGLVPPPREVRELSAEEKRGGVVFNDPNVGCAACHIPKTEYTHRQKVGLGEWIVKTSQFDKEFGDDWLFKTPSLLYVGGTPPYYHDGSSSTLEELIERNGTRMGSTKQLSKGGSGGAYRFPEDVMKRLSHPRRITFIAFLGLLFALGTAIAAAPSNSAAPKASAPVSEPTALAAAPSLSASAAPEASKAPSSEPALSIGDWVPPKEKSPKPKPAEWENATPLALIRPHASCTASALREWLRISCLDKDSEFMGVRPLGGSEEDVSTLDFKAKDEDGKTKNGVAIILPVRGGDRRLLAMNRWESGGWKSFYIVEDTLFVVSELWLPLDPGPTITIH